MYSSPRGVAGMVRGRGGWSGHHRYVCRDTEPHQATDVSIQTNDTTHNKPS